MTEPTLHASAVKIGDRGVLIRGPSGSGKSSLVLQLLYADPTRCVLVADDRVALSMRDGKLIATAPALLAGLLEIRGQGVLRLPYCSPAGIDLVVDLAPADACPRMPSQDQRRAEIAGVSLPRIFVAAGSGDGGIRVRAALSWPLYADA